MIWLWLGVSLAILLLLGLLAGIAAHLHIFRKYMPFVVRALQETPPFAVPYGSPQPDAESVLFPTTHNLMLHGCYLRARTPARRGVVLFGLEFSSKRWACVPYCEFLREAGYDVFSFETRGQGESPCQPGYVPMVWTTQFEVDDFRAAIAYLKNRPDADPRGIGFFGLSKGGSTGLHAACLDPYVRCCVTDGIFAMDTTMLPYMRKYIFIFSRRQILAKYLPNWYFRFAAYEGRKRMGLERNCTFTHLENVLPKLSPRPLLMIHGGADTYIRPEMTEKLFRLVREPKELWMVEDAKHNQAFHVVASAYKERIVGFFDRHLAGQPREETAKVPSAAAPKAAEVSGISPPLSPLLRFAPAAERVG